MRKVAWISASSMVTAYAAALLGLAIFFCTVAGAETIRVGGIAAEETCA